MTTYQGGVDFAALVHGNIQSCLLVLYSYYARVTGLKLKFTCNKISCQSFIKKHKKGPNSPVMEGVRTLQRVFSCPFLNLDATPCKSTPENLSAFNKLSE